MRNALFLLLACLLLPSCSYLPHGRANPGAVLPVDVVTEVEPAPKGYLVAGAYDPGSPGNILLAHAAESPWTFPHEVAHVADHHGITYAQAVALVTPPNPSPAFQKRLALCHEIATSRKWHWQAIKDRWGESAVNHPEILARLK